MLGHTRWRVVACLVLLVWLAGRRAEAQGCSTPPVFAGLASASAANQGFCGIALSWAAATPSCGGTITYSVYRSTTFGFTPGPGNLVAAGVTGTSLLDRPALAANTTYEYVVRAVETATSTVEDPNVVRRRTTPGGPVVVTATTFFDDFDANRPADASTRWVPTTAAASINVVTCHHHSPVSAYRIGAVGTVCNSPSTEAFYPQDLDANLVLGGDGSVAGIDGFDLTSKVGGTFTFRLRYSLENGYDYLNLFYSTTSASGPWTEVSSLTGFSEEPDGAWPLVPFNLDGFTGGKVWFRFQVLSDSIVEYPDGVFLDDVKVETKTAACSTLGPPASLAFATQPSGAAAGAAIAPAVTLHVVDANGNVVPDAGNPVSIAIATNPAGGTLSGTTTVAASGGIATFGDLAIERAGNGYTLAATSPVLTGAVSAAFDIVPAAPHHLAVVQQPSSIAAGQPFAPSVAIEIVDSFGNRIASPAVVALGFAANPALGSLLGSSWQFAAAGLATFPGLSVDKAGSGYALTAASTGVAGVTTGTFDVVAGAPHHATFVQQPTGAVPGNPLSPTVSLAVRDAYDNLCTGYAQPLSVVLFDNPTGASLTGGTANAVGGIASFPNLAVSKPGLGYTLFGGASGIFGSISTSFDVDGSTDFYTLAPCRVVDTRTPADGPALENNLVRTFAVAGAAGGCAIPASARAVALNVAAVAPGQDGLLLVFADGTSPPTVGGAAVSLRAGRTLANNGIAPLASDGSGELRVYYAPTVPPPSGTSTVHVTIDVVGYFCPPGGCT